MGFFSKLFEKKTCAICGGEIGLLGNRKLEDGNMCKTCAGKLSPFFSDRRSSTVAQIQEQLAYREENKKAVAAFNTTLSLGDDTKLLVDEDAGKFMVTDARNLLQENPDVLDFSQVTGCQVDIEEDRDEEMRKDDEGNEVSYTPPRYNYRYDFTVVIHVNHPYFNEISFQLNDTSVETTDGMAVPVIRKPDPRSNAEYAKYEDMASQIKELLTESRTRARQEAKDAAAPKAPVTCVHCGALTMPDARGCCEYCGGRATE